MKKKRKRMKSNFISLIASKFTQVLHNLKTISHLQKKSTWEKHKHKQSWQETIKEGKNNRYIFFTNNATSSISHFAIRSEENG